MYTRTTERAVFATHPDRWYAEAHERLSPDEFADLHRAVNEFLDRNESMIGRNTKIRLTLERTV